VFEEVTGKASINMTNWYVGIEGNPRDVDHLSVQFPNAEFKVQTIDDSPHLVCPGFEDLTEAHQVRDIAEEFLNPLNLALASSDPDFIPLRIGSVVEDRNGKRYKTHVLKAESVTFRIRLGRVNLTVRRADGTILSSSPPGPTLPEMIVQLTRDDENIAAAALALTTRPITWGDLYIVFETSRKLVDPDKKDYMRLCDKDWLSEIDADRFHKWANFYRHGFPSEKPSVEEMKLDEAKQLVHEIFHHLVEHKYFERFPNHN
jgi:hypothetical protein